MKRIIAVLALTFTLAVVARAQSAAAGPAGSSQDEAAVRAVVRSLQDAWNAHDGKAFAAPFAPDADYVVVNGTYVKGREEIERGHAQIFSTVYKDSRNAATVRAVRFLRPDVALAHVEWNLEFKIGGETIKARAVNTLVLTKDGGRWSIAAFQNTPVQPQGGPPRPGQART